MATKNTKKKFKADIKVNLTDATCANDVYMKFADAKVKKYMDNNETAAMVEDIVDNYGVKIFICEGPCPFCDQESKKKENVFKRFWNWITRK